MSRYPLFILFSIFWSTSQGQIAELTVQNQDIVNNEFFFDIYLRSLTPGTDIYLAPSDLNFTFNAHFFSNPTISRVPTSSPGQCTFTSTSGDPSLVRSIYFDNTSASIMSNFIFINLNIPGPNSQNDFDERVAKIDLQANTHRLGRFKISGMIAGSTGLQWLTTLIPTLVGSYQNSPPTFPAGEISYVALDPEDIVLPIELLSFDGKLIETAVVQLKWQTLLEVENQGFDVERQTKASEVWQMLGNVPGAGNSHEISTYYFVDEFPVVGNNRYRLKQIDFDGTSSYSSVVSIDYKVEQGIIYPNPVEDVLFVNNRSDRDGYIITNAAGKRVAWGETQNGLIEVRDLPQGAYILEIHGQQFKFVKM